MTMTSIPKESTTLGCYKSFLPKNYTMNKKANHLFFIRDVGGFLNGRWIVPIATMVAIGLQEAMVVTTLWAHDQSKGL